QNGDTNGTFQFESEGMQMYLRQLKPTNIEDLIAMNSLYRPGPLAFIPLYIERKHGREVVEYAHPLLEKILKDTFGIMVYQEQIMQTAQLLAGYSLGGADLLRRAMGKKKKEEMDKQREIFVKGSKEKNDIPAEKANEIFDIMQKFAEYGFNRSHSAAYSVVAYQTAYLKANYPAEYMAAVLTHNMTIEKVTFFLDECNKMSINVLGPDVNESSAEFIVNEEGKIRFGLAAIKGTGEAAIESIIEERKKGHFKDIFDFASRINLRTVNKKSFESMAQAGAFDSFGINRAAYFSEGTDKSPFIEKLIKYGNALMKDKESSKNSLFGGKSEVKISTPAIPTQFENWSKIEKLSREK
ncbi:MAG: DNA polymerase III subunit alpha, partial [Cytophagales bacterium]